MPFKIIRNDITKVKADIIVNTANPNPICVRACLKNHFRNLRAPLCGIFYPHSVDVARYAAHIRIKSPTNWDSQLMKSLFQTRSSGTDLAFYVAAGREQLLEERKAVGKIERGNIAVTNAYNLKAKYIIHTVGPIWTDGQQTRQNERKRMINI